MVPNKKAKTPRRTRCVTVQALQTTMASLRINYDKYIIDHQLEMQLTTIFPEMVAISEIATAVNPVASARSPRCQMFASTQPFRSRITKTKGAIIHSVYTSKLHTKKIVKRMERRRTAANRTCCPLEVGVPSPLRLADAFIWGYLWKLNQTYSIMNRVTIVRVTKHPAESRYDWGLNLYWMTYRNQYS